MQVFLIELNFIPVKSIELVEKKIHRTYFFNLATDTEIIPIYDLANFMCRVLILRKHFMASNLKNTSMEYWMSRSMITSIKV